VRQQRVAWERISDDRDGAVLLTWAESRGPIVRPPVRGGFGSTLIEHALAFQFGGEAQICGSNRAAAAKRIVLATEIELAQAAG
jgi:two-component sensor histidine kinase